MGKSAKGLIERGIKVADSRMYKQDKIWSKYSGDKADIGEKLASVIRVLHKGFPLDKPLRALSVGSSNEPQFRILEAVFRGGLYLLDIEKPALEVVNERIRRQSLDHVRTVAGDYTKIFFCAKNASLFLDKVLGGRKVELVTLHHSLYYCQEPRWDIFFENLYRRILAPKGAVHAVMMAAKSGDRNTTSWLYGHFAGKYFGCHNDQDLWHFKKELEEDPVFAGSRIAIKRSRVKFFVDDFEEFMSVIWMIMLYPGVHKYTRAQKEEITEYVYGNFWLPKKPLVQEQDHLVVCRDLP